MKQILTLSITAFQDKFYIAYMLFVLNLLEEIEALGREFEYYVNQFKAAYNHLNFVYLKYDVKFYTEKVQETDKHRTKVYRSLRDRISYLFMYSDNDELREAARILLEIITLYGNAAKLKMNERTTVLTNLIEDFEDKYAEQVAAVGIGELLAALRTAQEEYMDAFMKRNEADSQYALNAMAEARKLMTEAYRDMVEAVNLAAKRDEEGVLDDFINRMNNEIRKNFIHTGQKPASAGGGTSSGSGSDSGSEDSVASKAARFIFNNGTEVKLRFIPGDPIAAPANTPGYRWDPEIPEKMPKRGKTFREVPIEEDEATATFHFFDHREEEIKQVVGSILHAPQNTEGYRWDPEVPATMPAEDTNYYEQLIANVPKFTITFKHNGSVYTTQQYEAGATVSAPEPPYGYYWLNVPTTMPEHDVTVNSEEDPNIL